jgi:hypothetical protein
LTAKGKQPLQAILHFQRPQPSDLVIDGEIDGNKVHAMLHRVDETKFPLTSTGIHFVNSM